MPPTHDKMPSLQSVWTLPCVADVGPSSRRPCPAAPRALARFFLLQFVRNMHDVYSASEKMAQALLEGELSMVPQPYVLFLITIGRKVNPSYQVYMQVGAR
jgi:hypothetical protein